MDGADVDGADVDGADGADVEGEVDPPLSINAGSMAAASPNPLVIASAALEARTTAGVFSSCFMQDDRGLSSSTGLPRIAGIVKTCAQIMHN